jgi:hypothetical protein
MEITNTTPLKPGRYWKSERTDYVLNKHFPHRKFVQTIHIQCESHQGNYGVYYNTEDIKSIIGENIFELIECELITHLITHIIE